LIWLGKQYLHQSDHLKLSGDENEPLKFSFDWVKDDDPPAEGTQTED
jgi:hypothetical protein